METAQREILTHSALQEYACWLQLTQADELTRQLLSQYQQSGQRIIGLLSERKGKSAAEYLQGLVENLLSSLAGPEPLAYLSQRIQVWQSGQHPALEVNDISLNDSLELLSTLKNLLLTPLAKYTQKVSEAIQITQALDEVFTSALQMINQSHSDINQAAVAERNAFLQSIFQNINTGIAVIDHKMRYLEWNPYMEKVFDRPYQEVVGRTLAEVFTPELQEDFKQEAEPVFRGEVQVNPKVAYHSRPGFYSCTLIPLKSHWGKARIFGVLMLLQDITEQEKQQGHLQESLEELTRSQKKLKRTVRQLEEAQALAHIGHWEYNINRDKIYWSKELWRIFGLQQHDSLLNYQTYLQYVHPSDRRVVQRVLRACLNRQQPYILEHRICRPDGNVRWLLSQGQVITNKAGKPVKLRGTALDITRQKEAEIQAQEEQHFIKSVTTTTPDVITVFDLNKKEIIYANRELYETFGYEKETLDELKALTGPQQIAKVVAPNDVPKIFRFLESFRHFKGHGHREIEYRAVNAEGKILWMLGRYTPFKRTPEGEVTQVIGILQNISAQKRNAQALQISEARLRKHNLKLEAEVTKRTFELQQKNRELTRKNLDLDNFVYTASHDLKVPIANLEGLLTLLDNKLQEGLTPRERELLGMVHTSINRLKKTITDLTDVARIQKELEEEEFDEISFNEVLTDALADMKGFLEEKKAKVHAHAEVDALNFNQKNLRSILTNLISNAVKYQHPQRQPQVYITLQKADNKFTLLQVRDNGTGIPEKQLPKIFNLFKRLNPTIEGSGMGLYIVKRIVENSGGYIDVFSKPEKGTTFNLYLSNHNANVQ